MGCSQNIKCGGCVFRELDLKIYQKQKEDTLYKLLKENNLDVQHSWQPPVFIKDGTRRRATLAFQVKGGHVVFGFNAHQSSEIIDVSNCFMLTEKLNKAICVLKPFLERLCAIALHKKIKGKKFETIQILNGDLHLLQAENGLDIVLETAEELGLEHRLEISTLMNEESDFIRFSHKKKSKSGTQIIIEKTKPFIVIESIRVLVQPGDFLQASKEGEKALIDVVLSYLGTDFRGKIADLFCGVGTFSYALSKLEKVKIESFDNSLSLLEGFQKTINANQIQNITPKERNIFMYPLLKDELETFDAVVFDPPRAGASAQVKEFAFSTNIRKIIAVSCNPKTFARDAKILVHAGFVLEKITFVDQFVYSDHSELVALFTNAK